MALFNRTTMHSCRGVALRLFAVLLLGWAAMPAAHAQATDCSDFPNGIIDGFVNPNPPSNINVDVNCRVRNFPQSNPLTSNFSFFTDGGNADPVRLLLIFDNVIQEFIYFNRKAIKGWWQR